MINQPPISSLAIIGHAQDKFTSHAESLAYQAIYELITHYQPSIIISGGCHLGGVDIYAEHVANALSIPTRIYKPARLSWSGGYRERNLKIAHNSSLVAVVVVESYPLAYTGQRFNGCYHCGNRNPPHIKSGACWTAKHSRRAIWRIIK